MNEGVSIYLDNAATTFPKPETVYETVDRFSRTAAGNPGRGGHRYALGAARAIDEVRRAAAALMGARDPDRVILALNATDALNMAIKGALRPGDHAVTSDLEHNSVSRPLEGLARRGAITLTRLRSDDRGRIDPADLRAALTPATRLVALTHASNVLGVVQDSAALAAEAHRAGAIVLFDASQTAGVVPIDVEAEEIDLLAFTGHKALCGPMGTGGLVVRAGVEIAAWREGGTGGDSSSPTQPEVFPHYLEGGTPNAVGLAGLAAGLAYVRERGPAEILRHERAMASRLARALAEVARVRLLAAPEAAGIASDLGLVAFTVEGYAPHEVAAILDESFGIAVRAGLHCAPYVHRRHGLFPEGTVRASAGPFTTEGEVDAAASALAEIASS